MDSADRIVDSATFTVSTGNLPIAVSSDNRMASQPSSTALVMSETSALVGVGDSTMERSICVAMAETLAASLAFLTMDFWTKGTCSMGISTPMSPRATITPSTSSNMESMLSIPSPRSILAITKELLPMDLR